MSRFYNRPLLLTPAAAETISAVLAPRAYRRGLGEGGEGARSVQTLEPQQRPDGSAEAQAPRTSGFYGTWPVETHDGVRRMAPYQRTAEGVAIIRLVGEFVNRGAWIGASSGLIRYEGFTHQIRTAGADPKAKAIILDMESPGGQAVGAFEAAEAVRKVTALKPVVAVVNGMAASAAYAIASACTRIVTMPTGLCGSIGVVLMHVDFSKQLAKAGIKPTLIFACSHKVDGNPYEPLPASVRTDLQAEVEGFYKLFVSTVAKGCGKMT